MRCNYGKFVPLFCWWIGSMIPPNKKKIDKISQERSVSGIERHAQTKVRTQKNKVDGCIWSICRWRKELITESGGFGRSIIPPFGCCNRDRLSRWITRKSRESQITRVDLSPPLPLGVCRLSSLGFRNNDDWADLMDRALPVFIYIYIYSNDHY